MAGAKGMKKQKHLLFFIDISTAILLTIQIQSTIVLMIEDFSYLKDYTWQNYLDYYDMCGIVYSICISPYDELYVGIVCIVFCLNIYAVLVKLQDIHNKEIVKGMYRYFLTFNVAFVIIKVLELYVNLTILTHA